VHVSAVLGPVWLIMIQPHAGMKQDLSSPLNGG